LSCMGPADAECARVRELLSGVGFPSSIRAIATLSEREDALIWRSSAAASAVMAALRSADVKCQVSGCAAVVAACQGGGLPFGPDTGYEPVIHAVVHVLGAAPAVASSAIRAVCELLRVLSCNETTQGAANSLSSKVFQKVLVAVETEATGAQSELLLSELCDGLERIFSAQESKAVNLRQQQGERFFAVLLAGALHSSPPLARKCRLALSRLTWVSQSFKPQEAQTGGQLGGATFQKDVWQLCLEQFHSVFVACIAQDALLPNRPPDGLSRCARYLDVLADVTEFGGSRREFASLASGFKAPQAVRNSGCLLVVPCSLLTAAVELAVGSVLRNPKLLEPQRGGAGIAALFRSGLRLLSAVGGTLGPQSVIAEKKVGNIVVALCRARLAVLTQCCDCVPTALVGLSSACPSLFATHRVARATLEMAATALQSFAGLATDTKVDLTAGMSTEQRVTAFAEYAAAIATIWSSIAPLLTVAHRTGFVTLLLRILWLGLHKQPEHRDGPHSRCREALCANTSCVESMLRIVSAEMDGNQASNIPAVGDVPEGDPQDVSCFFAGLLDLLCQSWTRRSQGNVVRRRCEQLKASILRRSADYSTSSTHEPFRAIQEQEAQGSAADFLGGAAAGIPIVAQAQQHTSSAPTEDLSAKRPTSATAVEPEPKKLRVEPEAAIENPTTQATEGEASTDVEDGNSVPVDKGLPPPAQPVSSDERPPAAVVPSAGALPNLVDGNNSDFELDEASPDEDEASADE